LPNSAKKAVCSLVGIALSLALSPGEFGELIADETEKWGMLANGPPRSSRRGSTVMIAVAACPLHPQKRLSFFSC